MKLPSAGTIWITVYSVLSLFILSMFLVCIASVAAAAIKYLIS